MSSMVNPLGHNKVQVSKVPRCRVAQSDGKYLAPAWTGGSLGQRIPENISLKLVYLRQEINNDDEFYMISHQS